MSDHGPESERPLGVAMLGSAFMGHVHSLALRAVESVAGPLSRPLRLVSVSGRDPARLERTRARFGWGEAAADWREQVEDPRVELFINAGPNHLHSEPTLRALENGKHVLCEKPLALSSAESAAMWKSAEAADVVHLCGFNYRFIPAVRLIREMLEAEEIGEIFHFRSRFLLGQGVDPKRRETPWRLQRATAGGGALADLGVHHLDLVRYLVGEPESTIALTKTFDTQREGVTVDVDDSFHAILELDGGATAVLEASRMAGGHTIHSSFEIDGSKGSVNFSFERINEVNVSHGRGFRNILVSEPDHPFMDFWWPPGHNLGWADCFTHQIHHLITAITARRGVAPHGASFLDGYRCALICDAIEQSSLEGGRQPVPAVVSTPSLAEEPVKPTAGSSGQ
jgi:predicted dehydrogenase